MSDAAEFVPLLCLRPTCREPHGASGRFVLAVGPARFDKRVTPPAGGAAVTAPESRGGGPPLLHDRETAEFSGANRPRNRTVQHSQVTTIARTLGGALDSADLFQVAGRVAPHDPTARGGRV